MHTKPLMTANGGEQSWERGRPARIRMISGRDARAPGTSGNLFQLPNAGKLVPRNDYSESVTLLREDKARNSGSVIVIVMMTLLFAAFALVTFMEKASVDLLVDQRDVLNRRLRMEAYSALEMTLGVLNEFREVGNGLRSPAEGWADPLTFAGYTPSEGRVVEVAFEDESGKISLPRANAQILTNLFKNWGIVQADAEALADAMLGWTKRNHAYTSSVQPNYEGGAIPYLEPGRSLRSFHELAAIDRSAHRRSLNGHILPEGTCYQTRGSRRKRTLR